MLNRSIASALLGACLLPACATLPERMQLLLQPAQQVRHSGNDLASSYYQLGRYHHERGDLELALTAYTYAIARDPRHPGARTAAAAIHAQQGRLPQAMAMLQAVVADHPALAQPHNNLGYVYHLQGDYQGAAAAYRQALALDPANERARNNLALAERASAHPSATPRAVALAGAPMPPASAPAAAPVAPVPVAPEPAASARMEVVQLAPDVYQLKLHGAPDVGVAKPVPAGASSRLEIANGNGIAGNARRVRLALAKRGIAVERLTNARPFVHAATSIEFRPGFEQQAMHLQMALGGTAVLEASATLPGHTDLRLILGKDAQARLKEGAAVPPLLAMSAPLL